MTTFTSQGRASTTFSLEPGAWWSSGPEHGLTVLHFEDGACRLNGGTELTLHLMEGHETKAMTTVFLFNNKAGRSWRQSPTCRNHQRFIEFDFLSDFLSDFLDDLRANSLLLFVQEGHEQNVAPWCGGSVTGLGD